MGTLMLERDWSASPFGIPETWPQSLRQAVRTCLGMPAVAAVHWGPDLRILYNDACAALFAERHPQTLGASVGKAWAGTFDSLAPKVSLTLETGKGFAAQFQLSEAYQSGGIENTSWIVTASPLYDDEGGRAGVLVIAVDTTVKPVTGHTDHTDADHSFTRLFQASPAPILVLEADAPKFTIREVNAAYLAASMSARETLVGRGVFEAFPDNPDDPDIHGVSTLRASFERILATGEPDTLPFLKYDVAGPDGTFEERWWSPVNSPVLNRHGEVEGLIHNANDVTDQRRAVKALHDSEAQLLAMNETLRKNEQLLDALLRSSFEVRYRLNADWSLLEQLNGGEFLSDAINDRDWIDGYIPTQDRDAIRNEIARAIQGKSTFLLEHRVNRIDGTVGWALSRAIPLFNQQGEITEWLGAASDITARKVAEDALSESEARLRTLMEGIPQLVWRSCNEGLWTWSSPQWQRFTGQSLEESCGLGWLDAVHPDDREATTDGWANARSNGMLDVEFRVRRATDSAWLWHHTRSAPVRDASGAIIEWLGTTTEVHALRELQKRQEVLVAELQHRVRNMLTVVRSVFRRTVETGRNIDEVADHFKGRLDALARTQVIVTRDSTGYADLGSIIRDELMSVAASEGPLVTIDGPDVALGSKAAESIGLAIHELTTNAVKYGALKVPGATLGIRWSINTDHNGVRQLDLTWTERGVPVVSVRPAHEGFGRELIEEALPYRLGATTKFDLRGGGVCCSITLPLPVEGAFTAEN